MKMMVPINSHDARRSHARFGRSPKTAAVPLLGLDEYGSEAWQLARRSMIGASEMAAVLGRSPWASPFSLWWSKQEGWQLEQTLSMRLGHELEPIIAKLFGEARPDLLVCKANASLWRSPIVDWMACTPDYLAVAYDVEPAIGDHAEWVKGPCHVEPIECKSDEGGPGWGRPGTDEVPDHHRVQVLQQCAVFGAPRGHLVRMAGKRFSAYVLEFDDAAQAEVAEWTLAGQAFMATLDAGVAPELDGHQATTDTLSRLYPGTSEDYDAVVPDDVAEAYDRLGVELARVKGEFAEAANAVRGCMKEQRFAVVASTGRRFADRRVGKRNGYTVGPSTYDGIWPVKRGTHHGPRHAARGVPEPEPQPGPPGVDATADTPAETHEIEAVGVE